MERWLDPGGNASSLHAEGRAAKSAIDESRETLADALGCSFGEVVFTSGATESCNMAVIGAARSRALVSAAEHSAVLGAAAAISERGISVEFVPANQYGFIDAESIASRMSNTVSFVSVMLANNETGAITDVKAVARHCREAGALLHVDAVQAFPFLRGAERWSVDSIGADLVSLSAHKMGGPAGIGALYVRAGTKIEPLNHGGGQEREMRAGSENVAYIVGFAAAVRHALEHPKRWEGRAAVRDAFRSELDSACPIPPFWTLPVGAGLDGHAHLRLPGITAETMLIALDRAGVAASSGAACSSGSVEPSHVLLAMGLPPKSAAEGLRFTFGPESSVEEAREAARRVADVAQAILAARR